MTPLLSGGHDSLTACLIASRHPNFKGLVGAKPEKVCRWILDLLNVCEGDEVVDLYPGTGIMGRVALSVTEKEPTDASQS